MTDESMDARLRAAGEHWRAANETPAGVDVAATVAASEPQALTPPPAPRRPRHWGLLASAAAVAAALAVGGTFALSGGDDKSNRPSTDHAGLVGTVWELVGYEDLNPPPQSPPAPPRPLQLQDSSDATLYIGPNGDLVADDSCAVVGGRADVSGGRLTVTDQFVRYRSCTDSVGEMVFTTGGTKVLDGTADFAIDGDTMTISRAGTTMHFVAAPPSTLAPTLDVPTFVGAHWKLAQVIDAAGNDVAFQGDVAFFVADDGKLTASDGCNQLTGTVTGIGRVSFQDVGGTEIGCPPAQQTIQAVLSGTADESVLNATMTLRKDGVGKLIYQWVPNDASATDPQALGGKTWRITSVAGQPAVSDAQLKIDGDTYTATDGCREFSGNASVHPGSLTLADVPQSNPPCGGEGGSQASTLDSFLGTESLWAIRDGRLLIYGGGAQAFALVYGSGTPPTVTNPADAIVGRDWYLSQISTDEGTTTSAHSVDARLLLRIGRDGHVLLSDICAQGEGSVELSATTAAFAGLELVDHKCLIARVLSADDAARVLRVLDGATAWSLDGDQLSFTKDGSTLTFGPTPPTSTPADPTTALVGKTWHLYAVEKDIRENVPAVPVTAQVTLTFDGSGGARIAERCAQGDGTVQVTGKTVEFTGMALVPHSCPDGSGQLDSASEQLVDQVLDGPADWLLEGGQLTFTDGDSALVFKDHVRPPSSLPGTQWVMTGYEYQSPAGTGGSGGGSAGGETSSSTSGNPTFVIDRDGTFTTNGGCAPKQGQLTVAGDVLELTGVSYVSGTQGCEQTLTDQQKAFGDVFRNGSAGWKLDGDQLTLTGEHATLDFVPE